METPSTPPASWRWCELELRNVVLCAAAAAAAATRVMNEKIMKSAIWWQSQVIVVADPLPPPREHPSNSTCITVGIYREFTRGKELWQKKIILFRWCKERLFSSVDRDVNCVVSRSFCSRFYSFCTRFLPFCTRFHSFYTTFHIFSTPFTHFEPVCEYFRPVIPQIYSEVIHGFMTSPHYWYKLNKLRTRRQKAQHHKLFDPATRKSL